MLSGATVGGQLQEKTSPALYTCNTNSNPQQTNTNPQEQGHLKHRTPQEEHKDYLNPGVYLKDINKLKIDVYLYKDINKIRPGVYL